MKVRRLLLKLGKNDDGARGSDIVVGSDVLFPDKHYITILMQAEIDADAQAVRNMEPHKCEGWSWVSWSDLGKREDMFTPLLHATHSRDFRPEFV